ncbi:MAG: amino acid ABC transporter substrate-binding protein [Desulfobacterales bacterium]|nr:amino acid ABC transporter substrate-binding protein [Desulfobacterales bacterium]
MKKKLIVPIAILVCMFISSNIAGEETVRLTNGEWPPFMSKDLPHYGLYSHIVTEAFATVGVKVEYGFFPWKRSFILAERNEWDGSIGWGHSAEREKKFSYGNPIINECAVFFHLQKYPFDWNSRDDLQGKRIGVTIGYIVQDQFEEMKRSGKQIIIDTAIKDLHNFKKLLARRIDIFPCGREVGMNIIKQNFTPDIAKSITYHPKPLFCADMYAIFSKQNKRFTGILDRGLKNLHESGRYDQLVKAFINGEYEKK